MSHVKSAWIKENFGVDVETPRRKALRLELSTRAKTVENLVTERKSKLNGATHGAKQLAEKATKLCENLETVLKHKDLAADEVAAEAFDQAASAVLGALDELDEVCLEMLSAGTAQSVESEQVVQMEKMRDELKKEFSQHLAEVGNDLEVIHKQIVPGKLDLDLRAEQNKVYTTFNLPSFARPTDAGSFQPAYDSAKKAIENCKIESTKLLKPKLELAAAIKKAKEKLTAADDAAGNALKGADIFEPECKELAEHLKKQREDLATDSIITAQTVEAAAETAILRAQQFVDAGETSSQLRPKVEEAVNEANPTPKKTLQTLWDEAVKVAREQLKKLETGSHAVGTLLGISGKLVETQELNAAVSKLKERADKWEDLYKLHSPNMNSQEKKSLEAGQRHVTTIRGDLSSIGTLDAEFAKSELVLSEVVVSVNDFCQLRDKLQSLIKSLPTPKSFTKKPADLMNAKISLAEGERKSDPKKAKQALETIGNYLDSLGVFCNTLVSLEELKRDSAQSYGSRGSNQADKLNTLAELQREATEALSKLKSKKEYDDHYLPHATNISKLSASKSKPIGNFVKDKLAKAKEAVDVADTPRALELLNEILSRMDSLLVYSNAAGAAIENAVDLQKDGPAPLQSAFRPLTSKNVLTLLDEKKDTEALAHVETLKVLNPLAPAYKNAYRTAEAELKNVTALKPKATKDADKVANEGFSERLTQALGPTAEQFNLVTSDLIKLKKELDDEKLKRQKAVGKALGSDEKDPRLAKVFADLNTLESALELAEEVGEDELKKLISHLGVIDETSTTGPEGKKLGDKELGPAVASMLVELKQLGGKKLKELSDTLGGMETLADLCSETGSAQLVIELYTEFEKDLDKLKTLVADGFEGNAKRVRGIVGGGKTGAKRAKQLSDGFTDRNELKTLVGTMRTNRTTDVMDDNQKNAQAQKFLNEIANVNFGDDWTKLKKPFFDELNGQTDSVRLMQKASTFKKNDASKPKKPTKLSGFSDVNMEHILKRHTPGHFDMDDIKESNTQFSPQLLPQQVAVIIETALALVKGMVPSPEPTGFQTYNVTASGYALQIGIRFPSKEVSQFFPTAGPGVEPFPDTQMASLRLALGRDT